MVLSAVWAPPTDFGATAYKILTSEAGIYRIYRADVALDDDLSRTEAIPPGSRGGHLYL